MGDIKTRFTIEGEQQYKSAMSNAAAAIKVLNSEQKLAKAQFQNTGDAEKYAAKQADLLRQKIDQQKTAVKAAEQALKQLSDNGVAKNTRQYQQWQTKLNNAQTALVQMETELKNVNGMMQTTTVTATKTGDAIASIGTKVSFDAVIGGIGKVTGAMEAAGRKAIELGTEIVNAMKNAASWGDELDTTATIYGYSTEDVQRMRYTADILDTSFDTIVRSRAKLVNAMQSGSDVFGQLGVEFQEFIGTKYARVAMGLRDWEDVFWDVGDALMRIEKEKGFEYVNQQATALFGRGWEQLKPIFNSDWASADNYLGQAFGSAREYYAAVMDSWAVVSDENVKNLAEYDNAIQTLQNNFETLSNTVAGQLAPGFTDVTNMLSGLLAEFNKYLESDEGKEKMADLSEAVTNLFSGLTDVNFGDILDGAVKTINGLTKGLEWISEHWEDVQAALIAIAGGFALLKVSEGVLTFMQLLSSGKYLFSGGGGNGGGNSVPVDLQNVQPKSGVQNAVNPGANTSAVDKFLQSGVGVGLTKVVSNAAAGLTLFDPTGLTALVPQVLADQTEFGRQLSMGNTLSVALEASKKTLIVSAEQGIKNFTQYFTQDVPNAFWRVLGFEDAKDAAETATEVLKKTGENLQTAGEWTLSDDLTAEELMAIVSGKTQPNYSSKMTPEELEEFLKTPVDIPVEPKASITWNDDLLSQIGVFTIPVDFKIAGTEGIGQDDMTSFLHSIGFANGLAYVPNNGLYRLHRGEQVLPAREVASRSYSSNLYVESMYMNNGTDAEGLASAMAAAQRRTMSGYGS